MLARVVIYDPAVFTDDLYERGLLLVDPESSARIKRFYHRADACRTLIGRLLSRLLLQERGILRDAMSFKVTEAGKPYITTPGIDPPIAYNVTHDNAIVAMAFAPGNLLPPAFAIGIDIMKVRIPGGESFISFVDVVGDQLTTLEHRLLTTNTSPDQRLRMFFWIWTMKEAYTKALGLGLGFDFRRIEYDVTANILRVDGEIPPGWHIRKFVVDVGDDLYEGVVAEFIGGDQTIITDEAGPHEWLTTYDAVSFVERAIEVLGD